MSHIVLRLYCIKNDHGGGGEGGQSNHDLQTRIHEYKLKMVYLTKRLTFCVSTVVWAGCRYCSIPAYRDDIQYSHLLI